MNYDNIPKDKHALIIELLQQRDYVRLLIIHDEYKLTRYNYHCCGIEGLIKHYEYGVENGKIKVD